MKIILYIIHRNLNSENENSEDECENELQITIYDDIV